MNQMFFGLLVLSLHLLCVTGQNGRYEGGSAITPSTISSSVRSSWCRAQISTCAILCGGSIASNTCDPSTISCVCTCTNGNAPDLNLYVQTLPYFVKSQLFSACISETANNAQGQDTCRAFTVPTLSASALPATDSQTSSTRISSTPVTSSLSITSSTALSSGTTSSQAPSGSTSSQTQPASDSSASAQSVSGSESGGGLSTGAKGGIGAGVAVGVLLLIGFACFLYRRGVKKGREGTTTEDAVGKSELPGEGVKIDNQYQNSQPNVIGYDAGQGTEYGTRNGTGIGVPPSYELPGGHHGHGNDGNERTSGGELLGNPVSEMPGRRY